MVLKFRAIVLVQEKIDFLSEKLERESYIGDKPNQDLIEFETTGKNSKVKCKYLTLSLFICVAIYHVTTFSSIF